MKVILSMAMSANGVIATKTGNENFLSHANWTQFVKLANKIGCFIWGRKTYDEVIKWEGNYLGDLQNIKKIIVSRSSPQLKEGFILASSPEDALAKLENLGIKEVILTGGATNNSEFAKRGLIDEVILDINSVIVGDGIPIFAPTNFEMKLKLLETTKVDENIFELRYKIIKS
jgi:dihydrofolate reductase